MFSPRFHSTVDYDLLGKIMAEKLRRRTDRAHLGDGFRVLSLGSVRLTKDRHHG